MAATASILTLIFLNQDSQFWENTLKINLQGHQRILYNSRSLDIDYFERKYAFEAIVPHLHIQHFILELSHLT